MDLELSTIGQIAIRVHDLDRAVDFYRDKLGMEFLFSVPKMAFFNCDGVRLMLSLPESPEFDHPGSTLYFRVENIRSAHRELSGKGVDFDAEPHLISKMDDHDLWIAFFKDCDQNPLGLMCEVRSLSRIDICCRPNSEL